jgi:hypothetical protein
VTRNIVLTASLVAVLLACAFGTWHSAQPSIKPFITPGATHIVVRRADFGQTELTYHAIGAPYSWYDVLTHTLTAHGWRDTNPWRPFGQFATYTHAVSIGPALISDEVDLRGDANEVVLVFRRKLSLRWPVLHW